jgi:cytoskeleton protein RodZ
MALFQRLKMPSSDKAPENISVPCGLRSAGDDLRQQREALGLDLAAVAAALRIKPAYLAALEAGRPDELPGAVYAIGFMRAYADHLGLDGCEMVRRFKRELAPLAAKPYRAFPIPLGERSMPGNGMLLVALILAICTYGGWFYLSTGEGPRPQRVAEIPLELLPYPERSRARPAAPRPAEAQASLQLPAVLTEVPEPSSPTEVGSGSAGPPGGPPIVDPAAEPTAAATDPASAAPRGIFIRAVADSWIQIHDARQSVLLVGVLKAGESYRPPDQPGLSMRTGNAGGLEITVDGVPAPSIGRMGMVRRNVALDARALLAGSAVRD